MRSELPSDQDFTLTWAMYRAEAEPLRTRIRIYRCLAEWCGSPEETVRLKLLAEALDKADRQCAEFTLEYGNKRSVEI